MKKIKNFICKISPAIVASFTLALSINANSSTCFFMYQPKAPAKLDKFKKDKVMEKFSSKLIEFFVSNDLIKNEDKEIYEYAFNIILSSLIHIATVMILGLCFNLLIESLTFYCAYIVIRKFAGGYHAKRQQDVILFLL